MGLGKERGNIHELSENRGVVCSELRQYPFSGLVRALPGVIGVLVLVGVSVGMLIYYNEQGNEVWDFPSGSDGKKSAYSAGYLGSIPGQEGPPGEGNGNPLQYSCLENPMDGGAWQAIVLTVHGVVKGRT